MLLLFSQHYGVRAMIGLTFLGGAGQLGNFHTVSAHTLGAEGVLPRE